MDGDNQREMMFQQLPPQKQVRVRQEEIQLENMNHEQLLKYAKFLALSNYYQHETYMRILSRKWGIGGH